MTRATKEAVLTAERIVALDPRLWRSERNRFLVEKAPAFAAQECARLLAHRVFLAFPGLREPFGFPRCVDGNEQMDLFHAEGGAK